MECRRGREEGEGTEREEVRKGVVAASIEKVALAVKGLTATIFRGLWFFFFFFFFLLGANVKRQRGFNRISLDIV